VDVVLVHGTTQSPAGWDLLTAALADRGHRSQTVDLLAGGSDRTADGYAALAASQVSGASSPVVIGHSGAGLVLPAIGAALGARQLVWLGAAVPEFGGRSFATQIGPDVVTEEWGGLTAPPTSDPVVATYFLFHDCPLATVRWGLDTLRLFHPKVVYAEPPAASPPAMPSTVVVPSQDRTLRPSWMRQVARERLGVEAVEVDAGHCPHVSVPGVIADLVG
jgi:pimeloyl-ACP methyl ester carboxylesterase